jgi:HAD superfamily hydrolase (TIGR01509 family)
MQARTVLLFDIMDTLVYNPFNGEVPAFFGLSLAALVDQKDLTVWDQFELGQIDEAEYFRRYFHDGRTFDRSEFQLMMRDAYRWMDGAEELLERLSRSGFEIHALSNYPMWYRTIESRLRLSRYLKWTFVSCLTGVRKPAAAAFHGPALALDRPLESFLLIDDNAENCEAAMAIGMSAIHFVGAQNLLSQLQSRGLVQ